MIIITCVLNGSSNFDLYNYIGGRTISCVCFYNISFGLSKKKLMLQRI